MNPLNVLSLCDGYSCGQIALRECCIPVARYFASEIKKSAIATTSLNFHDTIQLGDLRKWREWDLPKIDLLLFGSPCQDFSIINTSHHDYGLKGQKSSLFFQCVEILHALMETNPDLLFLCENVKGSEVIGSILNTNVLFNDAITFCGCHRMRNFFTNINADTYSDLFGVTWWHSNIRFPTRPSGEKIKIDTHDKFNEFSDYYFNKRKNKYGFNAIYPAISKEAEMICVIRKRMSIMGANIVIFDEHTRRALTLNEMRKCLCVPEWVQFPNYSLSTLQDLIGDGWNIEQIKFIFKHLTK
ncbi:MAG: DNA cytosine methyltransferase [Bacteroidaceae bacterium]|nr:DNA cytosine methyltransferase [Bacteroidaceae bacterium]